MAILKNSVVVDVFLVGILSCHSIKANIKVKTIIKTLLKYSNINITLAEIRRIRAEQDAAFQETLRLDQERERQKLEAEEAEKARIQAEIDGKENIARQGHL